MGENNKNSENNKGEQEKKDIITRLLAMTHIYKQYSGCGACSSVL
jgi:hypothetical protein